MTKHHLMLSAATAALLGASLAAPGARADTTISNTTKSAINTTTDGNITIDAGGGVQIQAAGAAVTVNSNNFLINGGTINSPNASNAIGIEVDTTSGNLVNSTGIANGGSINLAGSGTDKSALFITGGNTFFAPITLSSVVAGPSATTSSGGSNVNVQGDDSNIMTLIQGTTVDGDVGLSGTLSLTATQKSTVLGDTALDIEGNLDGNLVIGTATTFTVVGDQARGIVVLGPVAPCQDNAGVGYTCARDGTASASTGVIANFGTISIVGTSQVNRKGGNPEGGSAIVIGDSVAGGFFNAGPSTSNGTTANASISSSGSIYTSSNTQVFLPVVLIDPTQSITSTQLTVRGPAILGPVGTAVDSVDGGEGYAFINHGLISALPTDSDISTLAVAIQGASATDNTCLSGVAFGAGTPTCGYTTSIGGPLTASSTYTFATDGLVTSGGLLDTGLIHAQANTKEDTNSTLTANALLIGAFATIPRLDVAGEFVSGSTYTTGTIAAVVDGPGGGIATAVSISDQANLPQIDVLQHGTIAAQISTSTVSPDTTDATASQPFTQEAIGISDQSGSVRLINNAGSITAVTTVQTPAANTSVVNITQAINLLAGSTGNTVINNSGTIEGDVLFNAGGGGNVLNVGNTGTGFTDTSGSANATIATVQGTAVTNTPYDYATLSGRIDQTVSGAPPITEIGLLDFGSGTGNELHVGGFGYINDVIESAPGGVAVQVDNNGELFVATSTAVPTFNVSTINVGAGGELGLTIIQQNADNTTPVVLATGAAALDPNAKVGLQFGSFISSGTTTASVDNPSAQVITLVSAPASSFTSLITNENPVLSTQIPFLFQPTSTPLSQGTASNGNDTLLLTLTPRVPGAGTTAIPGLGLSGDALQYFPNIVAALANDPTLGAAIASNITLYNTNGVATSGINITASQQKAQQYFSQFTPDVSGGTRQVAIMLTDQETGPTAARQRLLRSYGNQTGEMTLWSDEFTGFIDNNGRTDADGTLTNYKDHGFGFAIGMDEGSAKGGWYGGALSFYSGDVSETLPRSSLTHEDWYMLTAYSDWRGKHVFIDTTGTLGYANLTGNRTMVVGDQSRDAIGKRAGLMGALGATGGVYLNYGAFSIIPHVALDGMASREEGYTETGGGDGLDLQVAPYYANSLRTSIGSDFRFSFDMFGATVSPEARLGYRYDFVDTPVKLRVGFVSTGGLTTTGNSFTFTGPDPDTGNTVAGLTLGAGTDTWSFGVNYDWIRGNNGSTSEIGTLTLLGRI